MAYRSNEPPREPHPCLHTAGDMYMPIPYGTPDLSSAVNSSTSVGPPDAFPAAETGASLAASVGASGSPPSDREEAALHSPRGDDIGAASWDISLSSLASCRRPIFEDRQTSPLPSRTPPPSFESITAASLVTSDPPGYTAIDQSPSSGSVTPPPPYYPSPQIESSSITFLGKSLDVVALLDELLPIALSQEKQKISEGAHWHSHVPHAVCAIAV